MKILVSAIACDPYGGSEGGIGWGWVKTIAITHEVYCITSAKNRKSWDRARREGMVPDSVEVTFVGASRPWSSSRIIARGQSWLRFLSFNRKVLEIARAWHREIGFDVAHQVTYATWRVPSPLWQLPIPFVWGPVGGYSTIPKNFRGMLSRQAKLVEGLRDIQTACTSRSLKLKRCLHESSHIFAANSETYEGLKKLGRSKAITTLPSAFLQEKTISRFQISGKAKTATSENGQPLRLFAGGNIEGRKGVSLALRALALVKESKVSVLYEIAGGGPEVEQLRMLAKNLGLEEEARFSDGYSGETYRKKLQSSSIYLLPSFRETTPVTLLEAILSGCYPIVVDASAAGEIVKTCGGTAVPVTTPREVVEGLAEAILQYSENPEKFQECLPRIRQNVIRSFTQSRFVDEFDRIYKSLCE